MTLDDLGPRICILGPSSSGKSTLATAIARSRCLTPIHIDQLYHLPNTDWKPRPAEDFLHLYSDALDGDRWVMDGNYPRCLPQRLERATGVILLSVPVGISVLRYLRRSWFERGRIGGLDGGKDSVKLKMIINIAITTHLNRRRYRWMFDAYDLPQIWLKGPRALAAFYEEEGLTR